MSVLNLIFAGILVLFVVLLLRANTDIGRNSHQKIKMHEDLVGPFPSDMGDSEKLRLLNWRGISSSNSKTHWGLDTCGRIAFCVQAMARAIANPPVSTAPVDRSDLPQTAARLPSRVMTISEAAATAIGEITAYVVGRIAGRTFRLTPSTAQSVGEYVIFGRIVGAATVVTAIYS